MRIRILSSAEEDLEEGSRFYEAQSPGLGSYFLDSLYSDIDSLAYFAGIHQIVFGYHRQLAFSLSDLSIILVFKRPSVSSLRQTHPGWKEYFLRSLCKRYI